MHKESQKKNFIGDSKREVRFYENIVSPNLKSRPKSWWKHVKCLIGKKPAKTTMLDPTTGLQMNDKQSACYINNFFANLTKDYPKLKEDWLELHCTNNLPLITASWRKFKYLLLFGGYMKILLEKFLTPNMVVYRDHRQLMP